MKITIETEIWQNEDTHDWCYSISVNDIVIETVGGLGSEVRAVTQAALEQQTVFLTGIE